MQQRRANSHKIPAEVIAQNKKSRRQYITFAVLVIALAFGIFGVIAAATERFGLKADLTSNKLYEITDTTKEILAELESPVTITYFNSKSDADSNITAVLEHYESASDMVSVQYIDLESNPAVAEQYQAKGIELSQDGVLVSCGIFDQFISWANLYAYESTTDESGNTVTNLSGLQAETKISAAIIGVTNAKKPVVLFTAGHSEDSPIALTNLLENSNYELKQSVLGVTSLDGVSTVIIAGAARDFSDAEIASLKTFVDNGGNLAVFRSPEVESLPKLDTFLMEYGLATGDRIVLEPTQQMDSPLNIIPNFGISMLSVYFSEHSTYLVLPEARSLDIESPNGWVSNAVLRSTSSSYGKLYSEMTSLTKASSDQSGPFIVAATSERTIKGADGEDKNQCLFLAACTAMYDDTYLSTESIGNSDFMLQLMSYMNGSDVNVNIPAKSLAVPDISISRGAVIVFTAIFVVIIPAALIFAGIWVFIKRRHS